MICGDEHQMRATADVVRGIDAGEARHVDVEETDVGMPPARSAHRPRSRARARRSRAGAAAHRAAAVHRPRSTPSRGRSCLCRHIDFDRHAAWGAGYQAQMRRIAEDELQPLAQSRQPDPETVRRLMESGVGVGDADHAAFTKPFDVDVDPPSSLHWGRSRVARHSRPASRVWSEVSVSGRRGFDSRRLHQRNEFEPPSEL